MARLGDYIEQIRGVSYKPEDVCASTDLDAVAILRANNIQDDGLIFDDLVYVKKDKVSIKQYIQKGDIVVCASSGSKNLVGKAAIVTENLPMAFGAFCKVVRPKKLMPRYIGYFFHSPKYRSTISELSGGANINNIRNEHIDELDLVIVSEEEQERIINELDVLSNLISLRKQQLAKLDELVKSRFVELFESANYPVHRLGDVCSKITDGTHKTPNYLYAGVTFISAKNIVNGELDFSDVKYISDQEYDEIQKRCQTEVGDILLSKSGSLGAPVIVKTVERIGLFESLAVIKYDRNKLLPEFLCEQLKSDKIQRQFQVGTKGVAIKHLHLGVIADIDIVVPPLEEQNAFAAFVEQINKSKFEIQKSLEKLETLKNALMQKYFG